MLNGGIITDFQLCKPDYEARNTGTKVERVGGSCSKQRAHRVKDTGCNWPFARSLQVVKVDGTGAWSAAQLTFLAAERDVLGLELTVQQRERC